MATAPKKKSNAGRPKLSDAKRKKNKVYSFLTDRDLARLEEECERVGINRSKLIEQIIRRSLIRRRSI